MLILNIYFRLIFFSTSYNFDRIQDDVVPHRKNVVWYNVRIARNVEKGNIFQFYLSLGWATQHDIT